ncbi:endonuclease/exonuclease/phosphatase family domain-containing protein 1-like [Anthonomus grandis grandis]|uniref:endonuclease/exonuclease/phosphatase family domain-containing protein 1-like n=1 Tax=Anthonomus grandis grandis TaxID=2921223 RepID=UPI002165C692|nr:endonuclease/exonuclease/phosphatase family domain-containing protein 1-like [Anthonomus grandis grandis]
MVLTCQEMGNNASLPKGRRKSLRSFVRRSHKSNLSHTFTIPETDHQMELLNVNTATEEELMTLPGITREIAKNIVEHRKAIGRFRRVEDIAVVRGIGAHKLQLLKPEISVSNRKNQSCVSSRAPSYDSLKSTDSKATSRSFRVLNINKATVFDLQSVPGVTQEIAAAIVIYRNKKGCFRKIDDLLKVKHVNKMRLDNITRYLTLEDDDDSMSEISVTRPGILTNGFSAPLQSQTNGRPHRPLTRTSLSNGLTPSSAGDIFELLSAYSPRPILSEVFKNLRNGESAARICSWNLHELSQDKAQNPGVKEVICRTILENGISLLAVQDIKDVLALKTICEELNKPTLRRVEEWKENSLSWNFCMLDVHDTKLGFIYDSGGAANVELISLMESPNDTSNHCDALIAHFLVGDLNLQVVNMILKDGADLVFLHEKIADLINEEEFVLLCMDFSYCKKVEAASLTLGNLKPIFPSGTNTHFPGSKPENNNSSHITNILVNNQLKQNLTGYKNIVSKGITHLAIPNGWSWGGPVSPNLPIWVELYLSGKVENASITEWNISLDR